MKTFTVDEFQALGVCGGGLTRVRAFGGEIENSAAGWQAYIDANPDAWRAPLFTAWRLHKRGDISCPDLIWKVARIAFREQPEQNQFARDAPHARPARCTRARPTAVHVDTHTSTNDTFLLLTTRRPTLVSHVARHGYRTVGWMPGMQRPWPEVAFYGFERYADAQGVGYTGPGFGYWRIPDQASIALLHAQELDQIVVDRLRLENQAKPADLSEWEAVVDACEHPVDEVTVAVVGKYIDHQDAYKSLSEALRHGGLRQRTKVRLKWLESEQVEAEGAAAVLSDVDAILVPGGFGDRGFEGKVMTARYAREKGIPYFGICYGMQAAVVDVARHLAGLAGANTTENDRNCEHPVIALITEWRTAAGDVERRNEASDLGGTMRLGLQEARIKPGTKAREIYGKDVVAERHRHRYEFNNRYRTQIEDAGLVISAKSMDDLLVEMIELPNHPWFVACQAHPEFLSTPRDGHPLFIGFIRAAREKKAGGRLLKEVSA